MATEASGNEVATAALLGSVLAHGLINALVAKNLLTAMEAAQIFESAATQAEETRAPHGQEAAATARLIAELYRLQLGRRL
jgi:hypothetical protein